MYDDIKEFWFFWFYNDQFKAGVLIQSLKKLFWLCHTETNKKKKSSSQTSNLVVTADWACKIIQTTTRRLSEDWDFKFFINTGFTLAAAQMRGTRNIYFKKNENKFVSVTLISINTHGNTQSNTHTPQRLTFIGQGWCITLHFTVRCSRFKHLQDREWERCLSWGALNSRPVCQY